MADLLDGFRPNMVDEDYFSQYFWGDKNQGFDVLYHNMKHGQSSVKSLQEFIRESANTEDLYAKHLTKLAKQAANSSPLGTFAPMFEVFKEMTEKLSSCHMDVVHKLHDIIKDLSKYFEEQKGKQKQVKDGLSGTADSLHQIQTITVALQKSKEKYHQLCVEAERLKRNAAPSKEVDKADGKAKKASDDYKSMVEKYAKARNDYEQKMNDSAKRFQEIEVTHLKHMKSVLDTYIVSFENANVLMSQVHQEFRRQVDENTIDSLIKRYCESKGTGTEKPAPIIFEECDVNSMLISVDPAHTNGTANDDAASQAPSKTSRRPLNLPFRRKRPRSKPSKENNTSDNKEPDKETESIESPDKDSGVKLDDEGYTIRPETPKESKSSWGLDSSDSDSDDPSRRKILVKINPKDKATSGSGENNLDALNAIIPNLTLNSPAPLGGKKLAPPKDGMKRQSDVTSVKSEKSVSDEIMELLGDTSAVSTSQTLQPSISNNNLDILSDFFGNKATSSIPNDNNKAVPQPSSRTSLVDKESDKEVGELTNLKSNGPSPLNSHNRPSSRPNNLLLPTNAWPETLKGTAPLASSESWSSLSSLGGATPMDSFASSRGPSPLTLSHGDPIPIAVAFTETVNAYFKGPSSDRCMAKICGEVQISFPAGIVRAFTSNPNPAVLRFCLKGNSNLQNLVPNKNLLCTDTTQPDSSQHLYWFDMAALTSHIKKMTDANPNAPYYNIQVLSYQMSSQSGHSIVPLHLKSHWRCESDSTEIIVDYKYNNAVTSSPLKNIQVLVPVDGGVIDSNSTPSAIWIAAQNRLVWKLPSSISSTAPTGTLKAKLSLTAGPSKSTSLAVQFVSEGSTLTGSDFELTDSGYRVSLVKKRFTSGKYLLDRN